MAGIGGQVHERVKYQKNNKKKSRTKTRKGGWQALGFKSYQQYLIAKKNGQLDQDEVIQEEEDNVKSDERSWYYIYWLSYVGWELFEGAE